MSNRTFILLMAVAIVLGIGCAAVFWHGAVSAMKEHATENMQ